MDLSLFLPMWALIGFSSLAYPAIGYGITKGFNRATRGSAPMSVSAFVFAFWPAVVGLLGVAFPVWTVFAVIRKYLGSVSGFLGRLSSTAKVVKVQRSYRPRSEARVLNEVNLFPSKPSPSKPFCPYPGCKVEVYDTGHVWAIESVGPNGMITVMTDEGRQTLDEDEYELLS